MLQAKRDKYWVAVEILETQVNDRMKNNFWISIQLTESSLLSWNVMQRTALFFLSPFFVDPVFALLLGGGGGGGRPVSGSCDGMLICCFECMGSLGQWMMFEPDPRGRKILNNVLYRTPLFYILPNLKKHLLGGAPHNRVVLQGRLGGRSRLTYDSSWA